MSGRGALQVSEKSVHNKPQSCAGFPLPLLPLLLPLLLAVWEADRENFFLTACLQSHNAKGQQRGGKGRSGKRRPAVLHIEMQTKEN